MLIRHGDIVDKLGYDILGNVTLDEQSQQSSGKRVTQAPDVVLAKGLQHPPRGLKILGHVMGAICDCHFLTHTKGIQQCQQSEMTSGTQSPSYLLLGSHHLCPLNVQWRRTAELPKRCTFFVYKRIFGGVNGRKSASTKRAR